MSARDENPNCARTHAAFRLLGDALVPHEVTAAVRLPPTRALAKGEEIPAGRWGKARRQRIGVWLLESSELVDSTALELHVVALLDIIEPAAGPLASLRAHCALRADFICVWWSREGHGGPEFSPATLARVAALDASLGIEFFDASREESE